MMRNVSQKAGFASVSAMKSSRTVRQSVLAFVWLHSTPSGSKLRRYFNIESENDATMTSVVLREQEAFGRCEDGLDRRAPLVHSFALFHSVREALFIDRRR